MQCFKQDEPIYFSLILFNIQCIQDFRTQTNIETRNKKQNCKNKKRKTYENMYIYLVANKILNDIDSFKILILYLRKKKFVKCQKNIKLDTQFLFQQKCDLNRNVQSCYNTEIQCISMRLPSSIAEILERELCQDNMANNRDYLWSKQKRDYVLLCTTKAIIRR